MEIDEILQNKREEILRVAARHGVKNVRVFGSALHGKARPDSDIDFLVDVEPEYSLFDVGGLLMDLQALLGRNIDVVTENGLHWYIRDQVLAEAKRL